jgi:aminopeptidase
MYQPSPEILKKYADLIIKYALWWGRGCQPWEVVMLSIPECAKPMIAPLQQAVLESGWHPLINFIPDGVDINFYEHASDEQLSYIPHHRMSGTLQDITHNVRVLAEYDKHSHDHIPSDKMMLSVKAWMPYKKQLLEASDRGEKFWNLFLYGTPAMAEEAGMTLEEYRTQIIKACHLDQDDPIVAQKITDANICTIKDWLNGMKMTSVHMIGEDCDIIIKLWANRKWLAGRGFNIPSFEHFITPDYRGTNWWIRYNQPIFRYNKLIKWVELHFANGQITQASASYNEQALLDMIAVPWANQLGEYSLTDRRISRIDRYMGEILYDENMGGPYGNTHTAIGSSFRESYHGDNYDSLTEAQWDALGFNESAVHTDIISTADRTVTATLTDGSEVVIYKDGEFQIELG